jgi:hypothetical protein
VELKNPGFAYMDGAGGAPSRCGVPIRRPGKGREQDAVSFTLRLSEHFYIADFKLLENQEPAHWAVMNLQIQVLD